MKNYFAFIVLVILLVSCDTSEEFLEGINNRPTISIATESETNSIIVDSVKTLGVIGQFPYEFELVVDDINGNISGIGISDDVTDPYLLIQYDSVLIDIEVAYVDPAENRIKMTAYFTSSGSQEISFIAVDDFNASDTSKLVLEAFDNMTPVVNYEVLVNSSVSDIKTIDLSGSFDRDSKYGGEIYSYNFNIDGNGYELFGKSTLHYSFPGAGTYKASVFVTDNNLETNETKVFEITIE